ncbi:MAG: NAD(P)/FAD-dependent oxidoreductase [Muribaculaceae bacterium]|nr:NAD(P)/FAD-dependent oxidoreductase [Muribaculaceae bacterium]
MIEDITLRVSPDIAADKEKLAQVLVRTVKTGQLNDWRIVRKSVDARGKAVIINVTLRLATGSDKVVPSDYKETEFKPVGASAPQVIIVGAGPAGLFAALKAIQVGLRPIVLERGKDVDSRRLDLANISREQKLDENSNYCFGEGGAGAYSDGKLYTRSKKRGDNKEVLQLLVQHGASREILIESHPHIGSDKLPIVIKNIRATIEKNGGKVYFNTRMTRVLLEAGVAVGVETSDGRQLFGPVILATGHSARDVYRQLYNDNVRLEAKGFAMGVRLEHPQEEVDRMQYHCKRKRSEALPPAEYRFVTQIDGRGVYSFCMCPGGVVVPSASGVNESLVNGMSASARAGRWANSGMVVEIRPGDFPEYANDEDPFELLRLQEDYEKRFYEAAESSLRAPAQRMTDFVAGRLSDSLVRSSYAPGLISKRVDELLPPFIASRLKKGFESFAKQRKGFMSEQATVIGLESRTSSPIRIPRDPVTLEHTDIKGLYPAGEGAGYAGGIISAALDGIRCVESISKRLSEANNLSQFCETKE